MGGLKSHFLGLFLSLLCWELVDVASAGNAACCDCVKLESNTCKDGASKHRRQRSFCTEQTTEGLCLTAGGRSWVGAGTCRWTCAKEDL